MIEIGFQQGAFTPQLYVVHEGGTVMLFSEDTGEVLDAANNVKVKDWLEEHKAW